MTIFRISEQVHRKAPLTIPMTYFILSNSQKQGPFSKEELLDRLNRKLISYEDLCYKEGGEGWTPIKVVFTPPSGISQTDFHREYTVYGHGETIFIASIMCAMLSFVWFALAYAQVVTVYELTVEQSSIFFILLGATFIAGGVWGICAHHYGKTIRRSIILTREGITFTKHSFTSKTVTVAYKDITAMERSTSHGVEFVSIYYDHRKMDFPKSLFASQDEYFDFMRNLNKLVDG